MYKATPKQITDSPYLQPDCYSVILEMASARGIRKVEASGGKGGEEKDMDVNGISHILKVSVRHGDAIDALMVNYVYNGSEECTGRWGGLGGVLDEFCLKPNEYITSVKGHIDKFCGLTVVRSLKFETNLATFGPYGRQAGAPFELSAPNTKIIGFHAHSGSYLDALGVYVKETEITKHIEQHACYCSAGNLSEQGTFLKNRTKISPTIWKYEACGDGYMVSEFLDEKGIMDEKERLDSEMQDVARIVKIRILKCKYIQGLFVDCQQFDGKEKSYIFGCSSYRQDTELIEINFQPNEYITKVTVRISTRLLMLTYLKSIEFKTNLNTYGPFGYSKGGTVYTYCALDGPIIGFHGCNEGQRVAGFGVYIKDMLYDSMHLSPTIWKYGLCHRTRQKNSKDMEYKLADIARVVKIGISHEDCIKALVVHFQSSGGEQRSSYLGGRNGELTEINFRPGEHITQVKGRIGEYMGRMAVRSIKFITNCETYGPYGVELLEHSEYDFNTQGLQIIGFHGYSDEVLLEAFGVYIKDSLSYKMMHVSPAVWKYGPCGGMDHGTEREMDVTGIARISKIGFLHEDEHPLHALIVYSEQFDSAENSIHFGGESGMLTEVKFEPSEYVTCVRGRTGYWQDRKIVVSIELETNLACYGPYGKKQSGRKYHAHFEFHAHGGEIIGFHGCSASYVNSIGVYIRDAGKNKNVASQVTEKSEITGQTTQHSGPHFIEPTPDRIRAKKPPKIPTIQTPCSASTAQQRFTNTDATDGGKDSIWRNTIRDATKRKLIKKKVFSRSWSGTGWMQEYVTDNITEKHVILTEKNVQQKEIESDIVKDVTDSDGTSKTAIMKNEFSRTWSRSITSTKFMGGYGGGGNVSVNIKNSGSSNTNTVSLHYFIISLVIAFFLPSVINIVVSNYLNK